MNGHELFLSGLLTNTLKEGLAFTTYLDELTARLNVYLTPMANYREMDLNDRYLLIKHIQNQIKLLKPYTQKTEHWVKRIIAQTRRLIRLQRAGFF